MRVYIFSLPQNLKFAKKIKTKLEANGYETKLFNSDSYFFCSILEKSLIPDFIIYDYFFYNHHLFNIYKFLKNLNLYIPVIFFNEQTSYTEPTNIFWKALLKNIYPTEKIKLEKYDKIINLTCKVIDEEKIAKQNNLQNNNEQITGEKVQNNLKGSPLILFNLLYKNLGKNVEIGELKNVISKKSEPCKENTIYCLISKIRKSMKNINAFDFEIIKNQNSYKMIQRS